MSGYENGICLPKIYCPNDDVENRNLGMRAAVLNDDGWRMKYFFLKLIRTNDDVANRYLGMRAEVLNDDGRKTRIWEYKIQCLYINFYFQISLNFMYYILSDGSGFY